MNFGPEYALGILFMFGIAALVLLLVCREITCWYFKINQFEKELKTISADLRFIADRYREIALSGAPAAVVNAPQPQPPSQAAAPYRGLRQP